MDGAAGRWWRRDLRRDRHGSLLGRLVAAFVIVLTLSASLVALFETARNRQSVRGQAESILTSELTVLRARLFDDVANQRALLGGLARDLRTSESLRSRDVAAIRQELLPSADTPLFDHLGVVTADGFSATVTDRLDAEIAWDAVGGSVTGLLLPDGHGAHLLLVSESVGPGIVLVGGRRFDDAWAYQLRPLVIGEVVVVVDGDVAASTLPTPPLSPPGWQDGGPPDDAVPVSNEEGATLVAYEQIARPQRGTGQSAWLGVTVDDPLVELDRALVRDRLLALALLSALGLLLALVVFRWLLQPVEELTAAAMRIADGELDHDFASVRASGEMHGLASALDQMVSTLQDNTRTIGDQSRMLRHATERLLAVRDDERRRVAATLHDAFQQRLVVLRMRLRSLDPATASDDLEQIADDVLGLLTDLRRLSHDLYPSILRDRGLGPALHSLVSGTKGDISTSLEPEPLPRLPLEIEANAYFLAAEGLTNALKHAPGAPVGITARLFETELEVCVVDGGPGFDIAASRGAGLTGFEDRAAAVGGTCQLTSDENGTWVVARLPIPPDPDRPFVERTQVDRLWRQLQELRRDINRRRDNGQPARRDGVSRAAGTAGPRRRGD